MKKKYKEQLQEWYSFYRKKFFGKDIPSVDEIKFTDTKVCFAVGYTYMRKTQYDKDVIAISSIYELTEKQIKEVLIHEMIHIWQFRHVSEERYKLCTHAVAHDKVFKTKMLNINMQLAAELIDLQITEAFNDPLILHSKYTKPFYLFKNKDGGYYKVHICAKEFSAFKEFIKCHSIKVTFILLDTCCIPEFHNYEKLLMHSFSTIRNNFKLIKDKTIDNIIFSIQHKKKTV